MLTLEKSNIPNAIIPNKWNNAIIQLDNCPPGLILNVSMMQDSTNPYLVLRVQTIDIPYPARQDIANLVNINSHILNDNIWPKKEFLHIIGRLLPRKILFTYYPD